MIANFTRMAKLGAIWPAAYNVVMTAPGISTLVKKFSGFATERSMPTLQKQTLMAWYKSRKDRKTGSRESGVGSREKIEALIPIAIGMSKGGPVASINENNSTSPDFRTSGLPDLTPPLLFLDTDMQVMKVWCFIS